MALQGIQNPLSSISSYHPPYLCLWQTPLYLWLYSPQTFPYHPLLGSDCPHHINLLTADFLGQTLVYKWPDQNVDAFHLLLQDFFSYYYRAVTPYSLHQDLYPNSPTPPLYSFSLIPHSPTSSEDQYVIRLFNPDIDPLEMGAKTWVNQVCKGSKHSIAMSKLEF